MITSIKKVRGLGVFQDFTADHDLPNFKRFNLIYGQNGSGKTTLSRLFGALETGGHADHPELEFTVQTDSGNLTHGSQYARKVRVFNSDFIEANIGQFSDPIKHILILGQENKAVVEKINSDQNILDQRKREVAAAGGINRNAQDAKDKLFSSIAKTIGEATSGSDAGVRNYRKPNAEGDYAKIGHFLVLDHQTLETHRATVRQEQMEALPITALPSLVVAAIDAQTFIEIAKRAEITSNCLTGRSAQSQVLERLAQNPEIAVWIEDGLALHKAHRSDRCEFCDQALPDSRLAQLAEHFSIEDQALKSEIEELLSTISILKQALLTVSAPPKSAIYAELREGYNTAAETLINRKDQLLADLETMTDALQRKLTLRTTAYSDNLQLNTQPIVSAIDALNSVVNRHNAKTASFEAGKKTAREALEVHYLSTIRDQVEEHQAVIENTSTAIEKLTNGCLDFGDARGIAALELSIRENKALVSNAHAGGEELTKHLKNFLGRTDLRIESGDDGYRVFRREKPARRLSEGEKSAIAFLYFIVQLGDQNFQLAEGIVVIDDPISSLDASAIYQAFSFLKNAVKDAKQVFILTHNFDFLKLLLNWLNYASNKNHSKHYMILCSESENSRDACLRSLDDLLVNHLTEYHYLFKVLFTFKSDGTIHQSYHIPNVARKVLETFLEFHIPSNDSVYHKLEALAFEDHKKTAILKFTNDLSHPTGKGFDPALVAETQKNAKYLLELIQTVAPDHYSGLAKLSA